MIEKGSTKSTKLIQYENTDIADRIDQDVGNEIVVNLKIETNTNTPQTHHNLEKIINILPIGFYTFFV